MPKIITTTQLQQNIGQIDDYAQEGPVIVTNYGKANLVIFPYFEGSDEAIEDYWENYEMWQNRKVLEERYKKSIESGPSDLAF